MVQPIAMGVSMPQHTDFEPNS